jgi:Asp-tRNA(Asn)/Glu-tRNA(Gln) amidotransferase A subunit family amidase
MDEKELAFTPAWKQAQMVAQKQVSPVELTHLYLNRIERLNPSLNAYLTVCADEALAKAKQAESQVAQGGNLGPLHGVPVSIKDLELTEGVKTTLGSLVFKNLVPDRDSVVVERIKNAGAIILGKTNTPEFGLSAVTENRLGPPSRNPWNTDCISGGSSGGAGAALAAGLCALATGSDGGGSIRIPSALCGVYGIKPSQGRIPRAGGMGNPEPNQFAQSGPMSNCVRDSALLLQVLSGPDPRDPSPYMRVEPPDFVAALGQGMKGLRIAWSPDFGYGAVDPDVEKTVRSAVKTLEDMGCTVEEIDIGFDVKEVHPHFWKIFTSNDCAAYPDLLREKADQLSTYGREALEFGDAVTGAEYAQSVRRVFELCLYFKELMEKYDLLMTPTTAVPAFPFDDRPKVIAGKEVHSFWGFFPYTFPINMVGHPAASIPCGFVRDMPIGLHIVGRFGDDALVLRASAALEEARPWQGKHPDMS